MQKPRISISIVSHGQARLVQHVLRDLNVLEEPIEVILTLNIPESLPFQIEEFIFPIKIIRNDRRKGFGANHNHAFLSATGAYFCVLNPDIRLSANPFPSLVSCLEDGSVGVSAPKIVNQAGDVEDSARRFPTPWRIFNKVLRRGGTGPDYRLDQARVYPDWVGGMFMLLRSETFRQMRGFNERFFLYYEDVELCARLWLRNYKVCMCTDATVVHEARRQSHRDLKYLKWHVASMMKFFLSPAFLKILWSKR